MEEKKLEITVKVEEAYKDEIVRMEEVGMDRKTILKEISFALQHINKSKYLKDCSQLSKRAAIMNIANIGLTLNPVAKEAYLVPRWSTLNRSMEVNLEPSYIGLVKLLTDSGSVKSITAQLVYEGDRTPPNVFEMDLADNVRPIVHRPCLKKSERGELLGVYAVATLPDGLRQAEWMEIEDLHAIRDRSESYQAYNDKKISSCTWVTDEAEMMRKTVVRRIYKYLPRTDRMKRIDAAVALDNSDYAASDNQIEYASALLETSSFDHEQRAFIENELSNPVSAIRVSEIIEMLKINQLDKITQGAGYGSGDITDHCQSLA